MCIWKLFYNVMDCFFFSIHFCLIAVSRGKKFFYSFCKSLSFFRKGFPVKGILNHPYRYISHTVCIC